MYAFPGTHLLILYGPSHVGDHLPNLGSFVPIGKTSFHTKSPWSKDLALTFLSYHQPTLALLASILMRAFSRCPAKSSNSSFTLPEKLANATGFYCDTHNFDAISTFSATTGDFGCVRVTFCNQNLSVA